MKPIIGQLRELQKHSAILRGAEGAEAILATKQCEVLVLEGRHAELDPRGTVAILGKLRGEAQTAATQHCKAADWPALLAKLRAKRR